MKYFFSSYTVDFTISLFYSSKEFDTKHGKGNCEETCHQGTVGGNWKSGVHPKPVGEEPCMLIYRCAEKSSSVLNRLIRLQISHVWWTRFVNHTRLLDPLQTARINFCASRVHRTSRRRSATTSLLPIHRLKCRFRLLKYFQPYQNRTYIYNTKQRL